MRYGRAAARGEGGFTKFDYAATLAASLAVLCLKQRDAVGLALFDEAERDVAPPVRRPVAIGQNSRHARIGQARPDQPIWASC